MKTNVSLPHNTVKLLDKGVHITNPPSVDIGHDVVLTRISGDGVVLYPGTRLYGSKTLISPGAKVGHEAPVTIVDCQIGPNVELKGGFFKSSAFLTGAVVGSGAQVREGCLLEEEANANHTVGLKQTILFPFVTLGSLINFCDCLMAGGTSRKNHSEVGSSYIHFNYTPNQDKATASLIGDVPRGVMLDQPPIFLGGQGGLVGPVRIGYGSVIPAGVICRQDHPEGKGLIVEENISSGKEPFHPGLYRDIKRRVYNNVCYIANLLALRQWYIHVRQPFFVKEQMGEELYAGAVEKIEDAIDERLKRLGDMSLKMETSVELSRKVLKKKADDKLLKQKREFCQNWLHLEEALAGGEEAKVGRGMRDSFIKTVQKRMKAETNYVAAIQGLDQDARKNGTAWLRDIVDDIINRVLSHLPSCNS
ncbi:MAG TPA: UDP-N-acetylglucosamine pyrophosphorylase [Syntrophales bacterium]|nr:UDP-N-acetylglucosamine pyrophosphorylase [Syntrophales bacterium]